MPKQGGAPILSRVAACKYRPMPTSPISASPLTPCGPIRARIAAIGDTVRRIRTLGSTSLEMALVASGKLDAFVDLRGMMRVVDVAAGKIILEEAGGMVTDALGNALHLDGNMWQRKDLIGSNGLKHADLLRLIGGGRPLRSALSPGSSPNPFGWRRCSSIRSSARIRASRYSWMRTLLCRSAGRAQQSRRWSGRRWTS